MNYYMAAMGAYMEVGHKVTFDYIQRLIIVDPGTTNLDVKVDLYSDMKEWFQLGGKNRNFLPPIRVIGGDNTIAGQKAGDIYFMQNGWRVVYDPTKVAVAGVLFSDDFDTAWLSQVDYNLSGTLIPVYPALVSSLVTGIDIEAVTAPSASTNADAVRAELAAELALIDAPISSTSTQTSVDAMQADIDSLTVALAAIPADVWDTILTGTFPAGSMGEKMQQVLTTGNFIALK